MDAILKAGRFLFALPMLFFGIAHFMSANDMAAMAPFGGVAIVYITGLALIAAAVAIMIRKMDKLAAVLLGVFLILTALLVHGAAMAGEGPGSEMAMISMLKDLALAGGAFMYAQMAKDNAVIG